VRTGSSVDIAAMTAAGLSGLDAVVGASIPGIEIPG
jgi:hypothetical protein